VNILGFNCYAFNAAACVVRDGELVAAAQEERFNRVKTYGSFPTAAIGYCLEAAGLRPEDLDHVAFHWRPWLDFHRRVAMTLRHIANLRDIVGAHASKWRDLLLAEHTLRRAFPGCARAPFTRVAHHLSHAASAFLLSPFDRAAIMVLDGTGEMAATTLAEGRGRDITALQQTYYPHSLGYLFVAFTHYLGFHPESDEYKLMSLASYGRDACYDEFKRIIRLKPHGQYEVDLDYFNYQRGVRSPWVSQRMIDAFGPCRAKGEPLLPRHEDVAWALQRRLEDVALHLAAHLHRRTGLRALCVAGGVGLNSVMNQRLLHDSPFDEVFVQPAAFDAGCSVGAAFYVYNTIQRRPRAPALRHVSLGPAFPDAACRAAAERAGLACRRLTEEELLDWTAAAIDRGLVVGWFQGRMEFGPRALGHRSILADARRAETRDVLNAKVKHRESFRPFAPAVLEEEAATYFECDRPSPFMTFVVRVRPEKATVIPAVTHVDGTARLQTVNATDNPRLWRLLRRFGERTGVPVVVNTSFNVMGEPIVCSPDDAVACFRSTAIDALVLGDYVVER
jgi:carbamoyltransferase